MPGLKFRLAAIAAESNSGSRLSEQPISWQAPSRESTTPEHSSSARVFKELSIESNCPAPTMSEFYIRNTGKASLGRGKSLKAELRFPICVGPNS